MQEFFAGLAEIIEVDEARVVPGLELSAFAWDSLAVVSTIALIDEVFDVMVSGQALNKCTTVADILALVNAEQIA